MAQNKKSYVYELRINEYSIVYEKLQVLKKRKGMPETVFEIKREDDGSWETDAKSIQSLTPQLITDFMPGGENSDDIGIGLIASKWALIGNEDALAVVDWVTNVLYPETLISGSDDDIVRQDADLKILKDERYLEIFRMVDYSICGIEIDSRQPYSKTVIIRMDEDGNCFRRELQMDSAGVREFFAWAVHIFRVVYENKVVFADEMDRVLNPVLSDRVVAFVNGSEHEGQFVFSTHNVLHLNLKTYMKEQIYFITKNRKQLTSEMYSLSDFPEVRYDAAKIYEFYMKGVLGGTAFE